MNNKNLNANSEVIVNCPIHILVKLAIIGIIYYFGIRLITEPFEGFSLLVWVYIVIIFLVFPMDVDFAQSGIVIQKFRRRIFIPWEGITLVTRNGGITKIYGSGKTLTRYERLLTNTISIAILNVHYEEADRLIREKVGDRYKYYPI